VLSVTDSPMTTALLPAPLTSAAALRNAALQPALEARAQILKEYELPLSTFTAPPLQT